MAYLQMPNGYWTLSKCIEDAKRFHTKIEWRKGSGAAYSAAYKHGWLEKCCRHMTGRRKANGFWTLQRCLGAAKRYSSRTEWKTLAQSSYTAAHRNGWLSACCAHMTEIVRPSGYWTFERCLESASGFGTRREWAASDEGRSAYGAACREGWVDKIAGEVGMKRNDRGQSQREFANIWREAIHGTGIELREEVPGLSGRRSRVDMAFFRNDTPFLVVEYHGAYWHTEAGGKGRDYHRDRMRALRDKGIRLLTVHEKDKESPIVLGMIRNALGLTERRVRASKCTIVMVGDISAREFYIANHIDGGGSAAKDQINIGLEFEGRLIACMTLVGIKGRSPGGFDWCLHRFATENGIRVYGAAGRLFKHFKQNYPDASVVAYCDSQYFDGDMYPKIGFVMEREAPPDYVWVKAQTVLDRQQAQRKHLPYLLGTTFDAGLSDAENMERAGYSRLWDCGRAVYAYHPQSNNR